MKAFQHRLEYLFLLAIARLVRIVPRSVAMKIGTILGLLTMHLLPGRKKIALANLRGALPELTEDEVRQAARENFINIGKNSVETMRLDLLKPDFSEFSDFFSIEGKEHLDTAAAMGKGIIYLSGHIGYFEAGAYAFPAIGHGNMHFVAKRLKNPHVDAYTQRQRGSFGCRCLYSKRGARRIVKALKENEGVGLLIDQHVHPDEAVIVDFFNRPAYTTPVIAQIAMKTGTPVVPMAFYRTADDRFRVIAEAPIILEDSSDPDAARQNTQMMTAIIERMIRADITQWYWLHRRWRVKTPPKA